MMSYVLRGRRSGKVASVLETRIFLAVELWQIGTLAGTGSTVEVDDCDNF